MMKSKLILPFLLLVLLLPAIYSIDINSCQNLNTAGATYNLVSDVSSATTCFSITANSITLDCQGHTMTGSIVSYTYGIYANGRSNLNIRNCVVRNWDYGVYVLNTTSSNFTNNTAYNQSFSFVLSYSPNNILASNYAYNSNYGFFLQSSSSNSLSNNYANNSNWAGFILYYSSSNNTLTNNSAYNSSQHGFLLDNSPNNTLTNNSAYNSSWSGFYIYQSPNNSLISNSAYNSNDFGFVFDNSSANDITRNLAYNSGLDGFLLRFSHENTLANNDVNSSIWQAFVLSSSSNNVLSGNSAHNSGGAFYLILGSDNNTLTDNIASNLPSTVTLPSGFQIDAGTGNILYNNTVTNSSYDGFSLGYSSNNNTLTNNYAYNSSQNGFSLEFGPSNNSLTNNSAYDSSIGFNLVSGLDSSTSNNLLTNNSAYNSSQYGFYLLGASNSLFTNNSAYNSSQHGFLLDSSSNNTLTNNNAYNSSWSGFYLSQSPNNSLTSNSAYNSSNGFTLDSSSIDNLTSNYAYNSTNNGFYLFLSPNNSLTNNSAYNSGDGFILDSSSSNTLSNNYAYNSSWAGFSLGSSPTNVLVNNYAYDTGNLSNAGGGGFSLDSSSNNTLLSNYAYNSDYGFFLQESPNSVLSNNYAYDTGYSGFVLGSSSNNTLLSNYAYNSTWHGFILFNYSNTTLLSNYAYGSPWNGFTFYFSSNLTLSNNYAYNSGDAFYLSSSPNNILSNNSAYNSTQNSFYLESNSNNNILTNNSAYNSSQDGFFLNSSSNNTLTTNSAYDTIAIDGTSGTGGLGFYLLDNSNDNLLTGNYNNNSNSDGFYLETSFNNVLTGNNASNTGAASFQIYNGTNNTLTNNYAYHTSAGFYLTGSANNNIINNTVLRGIGLYPDSYSSNNTFLYNNLTCVIWVIDNNGANFYNNSFAGNIYYLSDGTPSWEVYDIIDTSGDNWADEGADRPFGSTTVPTQWPNSGQDAHPYTENNTPQPTTCEQASVPACMATEACSDTPKSCTGISNNFCSCECPQWQDSWNSTVNGAHALASGESVVYTSWQLSQPAFPARVKIELQNPSNNQLLDWAYLQEGQTINLIGLSGQISLKLVRLDEDGTAHFEIMQNQCPEPKTALNDSACACMCSDSKLTTLTLGQNVSMGPFVVRLADVSAALSAHPAIFDIIDSSGGVIGQIQVGPGETFPYTGGPTMQTIQVKVFAIGSGPTLSSKWAQIFYNPYESCPSDQPFNPSTCACQCDPVKKQACTTQGGTWNDTFCACTILPTNCEDTVLQACTGTCSNAVQSCTSLLDLPTGDSPGYSACRCDCPNYTEARLNVTESTTFSNDHFTLRLNNITLNWSDINNGVGHFQSDINLYDAAVNQSFVLTNITPDQSLTIVPVHNVASNSFWAEVSTFSDEITLQDGYRYNLVSSGAPDANLKVSLLWKNRDYSGASSSSAPDSLREVVLYDEDTFVGTKYVAGDSYDFPKSGSAFRLTYNGLDLTDADYVPLTITSVGATSYYVSSYYVSNATSGADCTDAANRLTYTAKWIRFDSAGNFGSEGASLLGNYQVNTFYLDPVGGRLNSSGNGVNLSAPLNGMQAPSSALASSALYKPQIFFEPPGYTCYINATIDISAPNATLDGQPIPPSASNTVRFNAAGADSGAYGLFYFTGIAKSNASMSGAIGSFVYQEDAGRNDSIEHTPVYLRIPFLNGTGTWQFKSLDPVTSKAYYHGIRDANGVTNAYAPTVVSERGTKITDVALSDYSMQAATRVAHPTFDFNSNANVFNTSITDTIDKYPNNRINTLPEDKYSASLSNSDSGSILSPLRGAPISSQEASNLHRIGADEYAGFANQTIRDELASSDFTYTEQQGFWVGSSADGVIYGPGSAYRQVVAKPNIAVYNLRFSGNDYGIPVCTSGLSNPNDWASCSPTSPYHTDQHRLQMQFLGGQWILTQMNASSTPLSSSSGAVNGGKIKLAKEINYAVIFPGSSISSDNGLSARLIASGTNSTQATFEILDENGNVLDTVTVPIGTTYPYLASDGRTIKLHLYNTAAGTPAHSDVRAYGPCDSPKTYNLTTCSCQCNQTQKQDCTTQGGTWNDTTCSCSLMAATCEQASVPVCTATTACSIAPKNCSNIANDFCSCECPQWQDSWAANVGDSHAVASGESVVYSDYYGSHIRVNLTNAANNDELDWASMQVGQTVNFNGISGPVSVKLVRLDSDGQLIDRLQLNPGASTVLSANGNNYQVDVCQTASGLTYTRDWAKLKVTPTSSATTPSCPGSTTLDIGNQIQQGSLTLRLADLGRETGSDNNHSAIFDVLDSNDQVVDQIQLNPGTSTVLSSNGNNYQVEVCDTAPGVALLAKWAKVKLTPTSSAATPSCPGFSTLDLGNTIQQGGLTLRLADLGVSTDSDNKHSAIFDVLDSNDQVVDQIQLNPGTSTILSSNGNNYQVDVCQTAPGLTYTRDWAKLKVTPTSSATTPSCPGSTTLDIGNQIQQGSLTLRLADLGVSTGSDNNHSAIFDVLDSSNQIIDQIQLNPGASTVLSSNGNNYQVEVCQTAPGLTLNSKWAKVKVTPTSAAETPICPGFTTLDIGNVVQQGSLTLRLADLGLGTGSDNKHSAIFDVLDSNNQLIDKIQLNPGTSTILSSNGNNYQVEVCQTASGFAVSTKWAKVKLTPTSSAATPSCPGSTTVDIGNQIQQGSLTLRLVDLGFETGSDNKNSAIFDVLDSSNQIIDQIQLNPGTSTILSANGNNYQVDVCQTAPGYTLNAKWAKVKVTPTSLPETPICPGFTTVDISNSMLQDGLGLSLQDIGISTGSGREHPAQLNVSDSSGRAHFEILQNQCPAPHTWFNDSTCSCVCPDSKKTILAIGQNVSINGLIFRLADVSAAVGPPHPALFVVLRQDGTLAGQIQVTPPDASTFTDPATGQTATIKVIKTASGLTQNAKWAAVSSDSRACPPGQTFNETTCACEGQLSCSQNQRYANNTCGADDCKSAPQFGENYSCNTAACACECDPDIRAACPPSRWHEDTCTCEPEKYCSLNQTYLNGTCGVDDCKIEPNFGANFACNATACACACDPAISCTTPKTYKNPVSCACECDPVKKQACADQGGTWNNTDCSCIPAAKSCSLNQHYANGTCGADDCKANSSYGSNYACNATACACQCDPAIKAACPPALWHESTCTCESQAYCSQNQRYLNNSCGTDDCKSAPQFGENYACNATACACSCDPAIQCPAPKDYKNPSTCACECDPQAKAACPPALWNDKTCTCSLSATCTSGNWTSGMACIDDCPTGKVCAPNTCTCVAPIKTATCTSGNWTSGMACKDDCPTGSVCAPDTCTCTIPIKTATCTSGNWSKGMLCKDDCPTGSVCAPDTCTCTIPIKTATCTSGNWSKGMICEDDCPAGQVCAPNTCTCVAPKPNLSATCTSGLWSAGMLCINDCPTNEVCAPNTCTCTTPTYSCSKGPVVGNPHYTPSMCSNDCPTGTYCDVSNCSCQKLYCGQQNDAGVCAIQCQNTVMSCLVDNFDPNTKACLCDCSQPEILNQSDNSRNWITKDGIFTVTISHFGPGSTTYDLYNYSNKMDSGSASEGGIVRFYEGNESISFKTVHNADGSVSFVVGQCKDWKVYNFDTCQCECNPDLKSACKANNGQWNDLTCSCNLSTCQKWTDWMNVSSKPNPTKPGCFDLVQQRTCLDTKQNQTRNITDCNQTIPCDIIVHPFDIVGIAKTPTIYGSCPSGYSCDTRTGLCQENAQARPGKHWWE